MTEIKMAEVKGTILDVVNRHIFNGAVVMENGRILADLRQDILKISDRGMFDGERFEFV